MPNATRLTRFTRLLTASVGPLLTWERCQATIWRRHRRNGAPETADIERHPGVGLPQLVTALAHLDRCDAEISRHTVGTRTEDTGLDSTE
jgi:hypothetical protein